MSFSSKTKNALARIIPEDKCCQIAELAGLVRIGGTILISSHNQIGLELSTENAAVARKFLKLAKIIFAVETEIRVKRKVRLRKNNIYLVRIPPHNEVEVMLDTLGITKEGLLLNPGISPHIVEQKCCLRSYLRGVFLGAGSVSNPESAYHLEISINDLQYAQALVDLLAEFELKAKISSRKNNYIIYLKESEQIVTFLNVIGAHSALLDFENTRIEKDMRNQINRLVNCETANLNKTINASLRQIENIRVIDQVIGLDKLPPTLGQVAQLRLENPSISLKELGEMMEPRLGKSGVNHRMRKLEEIALKIQKEKKL